MLDRAKDERLRQSTYEDEQPEDEWDFMTRYRPPASRGWFWEHAAIVCTAGTSFVLACLAIGLWLR